MKETFEMNKRDKKSKEAIESRERARRRIEAIEEAKSLNLSLEEYLSFTGART
jgi:hypothetical protein